MQEALKVEFNMQGAKIKALRLYNIVDRRAHTIADDSFLDLDRAMM